MNMKDTKKLCLCHLLAGNFKLPQLNVCVREHLKRLEELDALCVINVGDCEVKLFFLFSDGTKENDKKQNH